ncbi:metal ABC transporter substrate-binding protein [uncultured Ruminococcus sp.]|uniref:metal ABC transporter substrate-binding protein n=1 Tax=uncultured Ruminococcus sp. TaxID=165186 RepID=UPI0025DF4BC2|nr:metal ABC transporter substrate-binding protein [uncultured Ruminococcus sp.]
MLKKKIGIYALLLAMAAAGLAGCGSAAGASPADKASPAGGGDGKAFSVVCTIFPEYDWTKEILGEHADDAEITYLLDNGADLHNYQPTADDILKISSCDLFVYVGGESDEWVGDALAEASNKDMKVVELMDVLGDDAKVEELKEGMQEDEHEHEHEHSKEVSTFDSAPDPDEVRDEVIGHGHSDEDEDEHEHSHEEGEEEYDEHVWLSVKNAKTICGAIEKELEAIDPDNAADYKANLESYTAKLDELDLSFKTLADGASSKTLVFGDRFPFRYFVDDYGLDYYAAFIGCSAETEASFETIAFLAEKVNELDCGTIFTLENSSKDIANAIISASGKSVDIAELNSLQSVSDDDIASGANYLSLMQKNYDVLAGVLK